MPGVRARRARQDQGGLTDEHENLDGRAPRHANGESMAALALDYGVGVATIFRVLHPS
jgi:hypothetical protein